MNQQFSSFGSLRNLVLLAPAATALTGRFDNVWRSDETYGRLLTEMQRLRGLVYLEDGALPASALTSDGRHVSAFDPASWHLLTVNRAGRVLACLRYFRPNLTRFHKFNMRRAALLKARSWCPQLHHAIRSELIGARRARLSYIEVGGWALAQELRGTTEALRGVLATYAWSQHIGGALGLCTATERNSSRMILKRLGGQPLHVEGTHALPYYDQEYQCHMELLRFDSREPNLKYRHSIEAMRERFAEVPVVCAAPKGRWRNMAASLSKLANAPVWTEELVAGFV